MPRFVVLYHELPPESKPRRDHWDFMLEEAGGLLTWALPQPPSHLLIPTGCQPLPTHRIHYLYFEGPISNNRGHVTQWDTGRYEYSSRTPDFLMGRVKGRMLHGIFKIEQHVDQCLFSFEPDTG